MAHAGGKGIALLMSILGMVGILVAIGGLFQSRIKLGRMPYWLFFLTLFFIWANISNLWSPYEMSAAPNKSLKVTIVTALSLCGGFTLHELDSAHRKTLLSLLCIAFFAMLALLAIDVSTDYALSYFVDPIETDELPRSKYFHTIQNVGHSVAVLALLLPIILVHMWQKGGVYLLLSISSVIALIIFSYIGTMAVGVVAGLIVPLVIYMAHKFPRNSVKLLFLAAILSILLAPVLGLICGYLAQALEGQIPMSWYHRLVMWEYTYQLILENFIIGHGFDSVRTFDKTMQFHAGIDWRIMSLHPHNFGLHIWVETGLVGVILAVTILGAFSRSILAFEIRSNQAAMMSGVGTVMFILGTVSYSIWHEWVWAVFILSALLLVMTKANCPKSL